MFKTHAYVQIINLDSLTYAGNLGNLKEIQKDTRYSFVKGDITERNVEPAMKIVDKVLQRGEPGEIYNIGGNNEWQIIDIVKLILKRAQQAKNVNRVC